MGSEGNPGASHNDNRPHVLVSYRGRAPQAVALDGCATLGDLARRLQQRLGSDSQWAPETVKLLPKGSTNALKPFEQAARTLADAGIGPGARVLLLASDAAAVEGLRSAKDLAGLVPFEAEEARAAARRRRGHPSGGTTGRHFFGGFKVMEHPGLTPAPARALALLQRLACDPAIAAVMSRRGWRVGLLSEMPPEGKVGVSAVCVLGYNVNQGQEISLRLRTDDMRGFRKFLKVRETLVHELAHNEFGPHDNNFKALNSELLREVAAHEAAAAAPGRLLEAAAAKWRGMGGDGGGDGSEDGYDGYAEADAPQAGVRLGGTLPQAATGTSRADAAAAVRAAAGTAALQRLGALEQRQREQGEAERTAQRARSTAPGTSGGVLPSSGSDGGSGSDGELERDREREAQDAGHYDPSTDAKEREMERLGSLNGGGASGEGGVSRPLELQADHQGAGHAQRQEEEQGREQEQEQGQQQEQEQDAGQSNHWREGEVGQAMEVEGPPQAQQPLAGEAAQETVSPVGAAAAALAPLHLPLTLPQQQQQQQNGDEAASDAFSALDSPAARKASAARAALQRLHLEITSAATTDGEPPATALAATLGALSRALHNVVSHPGDTRYQGLRLSNSAVARRLGRWRAAREVLQLAGFEEGEAEGVPALVWRRRDPGLAWLVLSVVQDAAAALAEGPA